jgi:hypothetical protein
MKPTWIKTLAGACVGLLLVIVSETVSLSAQELGNQSSPTSAGNFSKRSIHGAWLILVQQKNCQSGAPIGPPGRGLLTFVDGGTINETTAPTGGSPLPVPFFRSPGHGVWERINWNYYTATMISQRLNPDGTFAGWAKVQASFQLAESGNEFTSTGSYEIINPSGVVSLSGCSTSTGTRLE